MNFGEQLRQFRKSRNVSLRDVAAHSGMNGGEISKIERNKIQPNLNNLKRYAKGMRVPSSEIFKIAGIGSDDSSDDSNNNHPTIVDLDRAFKNHDYFTYHNKKLDPDTIHYIESSLKLRYGSKNNK